MIIPENILGNTLANFKTTYPDESIAVSDLALDSTYVDIVLTAQDESYVIMFGDSDRAEHIIFYLRGHVPSYLNIEEGMSTEKVIELLGKPDGVREPTSMIAYGSELGGGALIYKSNDYSTIVQTSYPYPDGLVKCIYIVYTESVTSQN